MIDPSTDFPSDELLLGKSANEGGMGHAQYVNSKCYHVNRCFNKYVIFSCGTCAVSSDLVPWVGTEAGTLLFGNKPAPLGSRTPQDFPCS